jgi:hypothetical protein
MENGAGSPAKTKEIGTRHIQELVGWEPNYNHRYVHTDHAAYKRLKLLDDPTTILVSRSVIFL